MPNVETTYDFPDDSGASMERLMLALPMQHLMRLGSRSLGYRVQGLSEADCCLLRLAVQDEDFSMHLSILNPGDMFVPVDQREEAMAVLATACGSPARWTAVECFSGHPDAMQAFDHLWVQDVLPRL
jgi:hypothetical protein